MNIGTILVPVDFSSCAMLLTRQAAGLAARVGARVVVAHIAELPQGLSRTAHLHPGGGDQDAASYLTEDTTRRLRPFVEVVQAAGVEASALVRVGPVVQGIHKAAQEVGADLLMIGTHGRSGFARLVLGSVAEAVARESSVPVMLVRREPRPECGRESCAWCSVDGRSPAEEQVAAETEG